jgi:hypothetical protein
MSESRSSMCVRRPATTTLLLALIPFIGMCFSVALWDRVDPVLLGLPFNLFWLGAWIVLSSLVMAIALRIEIAHRRQQPPPR